VGLALWPPAYEAALRLHVVHDLEHLAFFGTAVLFWWPIVNPAPRAGIRGGLDYGLRIALPRARDRAEHPPRRSSG
jgi:cytochrome c oxidase assembly factor CtaG